MGRLNLLFGALVALGGIVAATSALAQSYPSRPIKLIVPITLKASWVSSSCTVRHRK